MWNDLFKALLLLISGDYYFFLLEGFGRFFGRVGLGEGIVGRREVE